MFGRFFVFLFALFLQSVISQRAVTIVVDCGSTDCGLSASPFGGGALIDPAWVYLTCTVESSPGVCAAMNLELNVSYAFSGALFPKIVGGADGSGIIRVWLNDTITISLQQVMPYHPMMLMSNFLPIPFFADLFPFFQIVPASLTWSGSGSPLQFAFGSPASPFIWTIFIDAKFQAYPTIYMMCYHHYPMVAHFNITGPLSSDAPGTYPPTFAPTVAPIAPTSKAPTAAPTSSANSKFSGSVICFIVFVWFFGNLVYY